MVAKAVAMHIARALGIKAPEVRFFDVPPYGTDRHLVGQYNGDEGAVIHIKRRQSLFDTARAAAHETSHYAWYARARLLRSDRRLDEVRAQNLTVDFERYLGTLNIWDSENGERLARWARFVNLAEGRYPTPFEAPESWTRA